MAWISVVKDVASSDFVLWRTREVRIYAQYRRFCPHQIEEQALTGFIKRNVITEAQRQYILSLNSEFSRPQPAPQAPLTKVAAAQAQAILSFNLKSAQSQPAQQAPPAKANSIMSKQADFQRDLSSEEVQYILDHHQAPQSPPSAMGSPQPHRTSMPATRHYPPPIPKLLSSAMPNHVPNDRNPYADEKPYGNMAEQRQAAVDEAGSEVDEVASEADETPAPAGDKKKRRRGKTALPKAAAATAAMIAASKARIDDYMAANGGVPPFLAPDVVPKQHTTASRAQRSRRAAVAHFSAPQPDVLAHVDDEDDGDDDDEAEADHEHNHEPDAAHSHPHSRTHHDVEVEDDTEDDHEDGCTCGRNLASIPPVPCTASFLTSIPYSTKEYERIKTHYSKDKIPTLFKASNLKLRADHAHNTWYDLILAVRECQCPYCSDPIYNEDCHTVRNTINSNASYSTLVKAAREEYQKLDAQLDAFLTSQRTAIFKEWLTTKDGKRWPEELDLSIGQIRGMLPDGRHGTSDAASKSDVDFGELMRNMRYGDDRKAKGVAGKEGGAAQKPKK